MITPGISKFTGLQLRLFETSLRAVSNNICFISNLDFLIGVSNVRGWQRVWSMPRVSVPANCFPGHRDREKNTQSCLTERDVTQTQTHYPVLHQLFSYMLIETSLAFVVSHFQLVVAVSRLKLSLGPQGECEDNGKLMQSIPQFIDQY